MGDSSDFNIEIKTSADVSGIEAAKDSLQELRADTGRAGEATAGLAKKAGELNEQGEKLGYHTLREAAHAMHGMETAAEGGHMSTLRWVMSLRGLYTLLTANPFTAVAAALAALAIALKTHIDHLREAREASEKQKTALDELEAGLEGQKTVLTAVERAQAKLNEQAKDYEGYLSRIKTALQNEEKLQLAVVKAKEQTAIEQVNLLEKEGRLTKPQADEARALIRAGAADEELRVKKEFAQKQDATDKEQVAHAQEKAAQMQKLADDAKARAQALSETIRKYNEEKDKLTEMGGGMRDFVGIGGSEKQKGQQDSVERLKAQERLQLARRLREQHDIVDRLKAQAGVAANALGANYDDKSGKYTAGSGSNYQGAINAEKNAADSKKEAVEIAKKKNDEKAARDAELDRESVVAVYRHEQEGDQAKERRLDQQKEAREREKKEREKAEKQQQHEFAGALQGPFGAGATYEVDRLVRDVLGSRPPGAGTVSQATYDKIIQQLRELQQHGNNEQGLHQLHAAMLSYAKTSTENHRTLNKLFSEVAQKISQLEAAVKSNGPNAY